MQRCARHFGRSTGGEIPSVGRGRARLSQALVIPEGSQYVQIHAKNYETVSQDVDVDLITLLVQGGKVRPLDVLAVDLDLTELKLLGTLGDLKNAVSFILVNADVMSVIAAHRRIQGLLIIG